MKHRPKQGHNDNETDKIKEVAGSIPTVEVVFYYKLAK